MCQILIYRIRDRAIYGHTHLNHYIKIYLFQFFQPRNILISTRKVIKSEAQKLNFLIHMYYKAEFAEVGTIYANRFPSRRTVINKNVGNQKS